MTKNWCDIINNSILWQTKHMTKLGAAYGKNVLAMKKNSNGK